MAKQRPTYTISEIERELGYSIDSLNYPNDTAKRFYSDLSPIPKSSIERGQRELEERQKQSLREFKPILDDFLPDIGIPHVGPASLQHALITDG
jgi:serine phosphatase RsbU (regulator of sigma subunit)